MAEFKDAIQSMKKIIFLCHGNICRSPMAEYVMKDLLQKAGLSDRYFITSGAVSTEELGNPIYPPAQQKLREKGVSFARHQAHQISVSEFNDQDLVIVMDRSNLRLLVNRVAGALEAPIGADLQYTGLTTKVNLLMSFVGDPRDVEDPWYSGDFETTYQDVLAGCSGLLRILSKNP